MPRAVVCRSLDDPAGVAVEDLPPRSLGIGEVRVSVRAAGLNFPDVLMLRGTYQLKPELPFIPGMEAAGIVTEIGPEIETPFCPGDRVIVALRHGAIAEEVVAEPSQLSALSETFSFEEGATFRVAATTAYHALVERAALKSGETLLVHGAGGGVGLAAVELGKVLGARVIACVSSEEKLVAARAKGADATLLYAAEPFRDAVKRITGGQGADVVFDPVGGEILEQSLRCINWGARVLVVGFTGGIGLARTNLILIKGATLMGVRAGEAVRRDPALGIKRNAALGELVNAGHLRPLISQRFVLEDFRQAFAALAERRAIGRLVLMVG